MVGREEIVAVLAQFSLFSDLNQPQLERIAGELEEGWYGDATRILRQGVSGLGLFFIFEGSCAILVDGDERARLGRGEFFGEVSMLLECLSTADVVAVGAVRCLRLAAPLVQPFLLSQPRLMYRMLQVMARRLRAANTWRN